MFSSAITLVVPSSAAISCATFGAAAFWAAVGLLSATPAERTLAVPGAYTMS